MFWCSEEHLPDLSVLNTWHRFYASLEYAKACHTCKLRHLHTRTAPHPAEAEVGSSTSGSGILPKIQFIKKMWMLYVQQHWTKAINLKSELERLYEKLGALEFDADHETIYGMERYYTDQQCEQLLDNYKIGRKVCRKFLKGKTCSQCLVKRTSEIGLRHFLDTLNKYIKDCSDSDTSSSDEGKCKAVE
ncbi:hypothetical protein FQA39_LY02492 [Lamprigera yunnana]|nr:hypothetical protein FQA39_LY02492 [Lamprigera yunnana]